MKMAKEARLEMEKKQFISTDRMEKILTPIDTYVKVVDTAIQHSPEITYVHRNWPLAAGKLLTCSIKCTGLGWSALHPSGMSAVMVFVHTVTNAAI